MKHSSNLSHHEFNMEMHIRSVHSGTIQVINNQLSLTNTHWTAAILTTQLNSWSGVLPSEADALLSKAKQSSQLVQVREPGPASLTP